MNRFDAGPPTEIVIDGQKYTLNTAYDGCCMVWDGYEAMEAGELSQAGYCALVVDMMYNEPKPSMWSREAIQFASEFLSYFSDKDGERRTRIPPISIKQDWEMIKSSFFPLGVDLRTDIIDYGKFMYLLRNLPEGCEYANIMRLRRQYYDERGKMKPDELKRLRENIRSVGENKVYIRDRHAEKAAADYEDEITRRQNELRAAKGLPPV